MTLLLVGAFEPEIAPFRGRLPEGVEARAVGIGLVDAALGTARAIAETHPSRIVLVGSAGALPGSAIGHLEVVVVATTVLADLASARREASLLPRMAQIRETSAALTAALIPEAPRVCALTTLTVTTSDEAARALAEAHRAHAPLVENLEVYAVARAAEAAGIPFAAVLGVTNQVGSLGRSEWAQHHEKASELVCQRLLPGLSRAVALALAAPARAD
jgi:futalosine hydrolase